MCREHRYCDSTELAEETQCKRRSDGWSMVAHFYLFTGNNVSIRVSRDEVQE